MNATQRKYAVGELTAAYNRATRELPSWIPKKMATITINLQELHEASNTLDYIGSLIENAEVKREEQLEKFAKRETILSAYSAAKQHIMLGDCADAILVINNFKEEVQGGNE